jgi:hypothetical protein
MTDGMAASRRDPRKRNLAILGGVTGLFLVLAVAAVFQQTGSLAPKFQERPFFPGLTNRINELGEVAVTSKSGSFHVRLQQGKWVVVERNSFPADSSQVRATAIGVADLTMVEPKTTRADWLNYVGLGAPDKGGEAIDVKLSDASGKPMGELLVGHSQGTADDLGRTALYVRRPDENTSWLARGSLSPKPNVSDWLDKNVLNIGRDRIKGATVTPASGPSYNLSRDSKDQPDFKLLDMPAGRSLSFEGAPDGVASAIIGFTFDDVAKADQFDVSKAPQSVTHTFDGLDITVKIAAKDKDHWALLSAAGSNPMTQAEAAMINARLKDWAFKLPEMRTEQFVATRETLLKPPGGPEPATAAKPK